MNILLTNDDGIKSPGIQKLAEALRSRLKHRVYVMAPDINRSGISHAISLLSMPSKVIKLEEDTWSCSGYPADCVIIALKGEIPELPDLVISGINQGANLGTDVIYSGTAAAARQGSLAGIPSIALSLVGNENYHWDMAVSWAIEHLEELVELWKKDTFVNVNIPNSKQGPEGMVMSKPVLKHYDDSLKVVSVFGAKWCFLTGGEEITAVEEGSDWEVVSRNYVSISSIFNHPVVK